MEEKSLIRFLTSFFSLFKATVINHTLINRNLFGTVAWHGEDETQDFYWEVGAANNIFETQLLCDYLANNNLINGDRIIISEDELIRNLIKLGWEKTTVVEAINSLCNIDIRMIDEGEKTDSFFVHF